MATTFEGEEMLIPHTHTATMRAVVFHGVDDIRVEYVPRPHAGPCQAVIRVTMTTICGTDLHIVRGEYREQNVTARAAAFQSRIAVVPLKVPPSSCTTPSLTKQRANRGASPACSAPKYSAIGFASEIDMARPPSSGE